MTRAHRLHWVEKIEETIIHPVARANGVSMDDIAEGMPATVRIAGWNEGPATVVQVARAKDGRVWKVHARPDYTDVVYWSEVKGKRVERPMTLCFLLSAWAGREYMEPGERCILCRKHRSEVAPALRTTALATGFWDCHCAPPAYDWKALRFGTSRHEPIWNHRRLLLGHAAMRDDQWTNMVHSYMATVRPDLIEGTVDDAGLKERTNRFSIFETTIAAVLRSQGIRAGHRDTIDTLLGRASPPREVRPNP